MWGGNGLAVGVPAQTAGQHSARGPDGIPPTPGVLLHRTTRAAEMAMALPLRSQRKLRAFSTRKRLTRCARTGKVRNTVAAGATQGRRQRPPPCRRSTGSPLVAAGATQPAVAGGSVFVSFDAGSVVWSVAGRGRAVSGDAVTPASRKFCVTACAGICVAGGLGASCPGSRPGTCQSRSQRASHAAPLHMPPAVQRC